MIGFVTGDFETSLDRVNEFVLFAETSHSSEQLLNSKIYQKLGETQIEVGLYHEAIASLTKSIQKDPTNKESYLSRAAAYFETGDFDSAIQDFRTSEVQTSNKQIQSKVSAAFQSALLNGIVEGGKEATIEFLPSLCKTAYGLGECLWCFAQQPIDTSALKFGCGHVFRRKSSHPLGDVRFSRKRADSQISAHLCHLNCRF